MNTSSKNTPCPLCSRDDRSGKCRWSDNFIFCFRGDSYSPPDLRVGQVIELPGWPPMAVVRADGGFAGCSVVLAPHEGRGGLQGLPEPSAAERLSVQLQVRKSICKIRSNLRIIRQCVEFQYLTLDQLVYWRKLAMETWDMSVDLYEVVRSNRLYLERKNQLFLCIKDSNKQVKYFLKDLNAFFSNYLGSPQ